MKVLKVIYVIFCAAIVSLCVVMASMVGLFKTETKVEYDEEVFPEPFTVNDVTITLDESFEKQYYDLSGNIYGRIENQDTSVIVSRFGFNDYNGIEDWDCEKFASDVQQEGSYITSVYTYNGLIYYQYDIVSGYYEDDNSSHWWCFVFKTGDEFWTVDIGVPLEDTEEREDQVLEWAESIEVYY